ncbi:hypothetical protein [Fluviispira multicolorata]|uniref:Uncharacterized protein n=1 Tax=Fluviispira multicolorata TaxID=2654512 RepID=A0A833JEL9_9BACT|nr:hypothetical protein [Fluviispira multicolorata]KAB8033276.1 hypothetical protein GCL57_00850 [Fluviispira multicolorata]
MLSKQTKKIVFLVGFSLCGTAFADGSTVANSIQVPTIQNDKLQSSNKVIYQIYEGNRLLETNSNARFKRSLPDRGQNLSEPIPSFPMPSFNKIDAYVNNHNGAFPYTWGADADNKKTWTQEKTFASLDYKDIGTELVCLDPTGCHGAFSVSNTISPPFHQTNVKNIGFAINNIKTNTMSWFYVSDPNNSIDKFYVTKGDGKFPEVTTPENSYSPAVEFNVKYNEPIAYIMFHSNPGEKLSVWNGNTGAPFVEEPITSTDSSETQSTGTFWKLAWQSQVGRGSSLSNTFSITHGLTKTETSSLGYQLGVKQSFGIDGLFSTDISMNFNQNWGWSTAVTDQKTYSTQISFPVDFSNDRAVAYYNLMLGVHSKAPLLEKFVDPQNPNGFNAQIVDHFVGLQMAKALPSGVSGVENAVDALTPSGEYIYGTLAVNRN